MYMYMHACMCSLVLCVTTSIINLDFNLLSPAAGTWIVLTEIYPSQLRGRAVALATSLNWATNILITAVFLDLKSMLFIVKVMAFVPDVTLVTVKLSQQHIALIKIHNVFRTLHDTLPNK